MHTHLYTITHKKQKMRSPTMCTRTHTHAHARYINEPREALKCFNYARKDTKWGTQATLHMVEVGGPVPVLFCCMHWCVNAQCFPLFRSYFPAQVRTYFPVHHHPPHTHTHTHEYAHNAHVLLLLILTQTFRGPDNVAV